MDPLWNGKRFIFSNLEYIWLCKYNIKIKPLSNIQIIIHVLLLTQQCYWPASLTTCVQGPPSSNLDGSLKPAFP